MSKDILDKDRTYGTVRTSDPKYIHCAFSQDLKFYDHYGEFVMEMPGQEKNRKAIPKRAAVPLKHDAPTEDEKREAALSAAADKIAGMSLGGLKPQKDAQKENAEALAAEDNA